MACTPTPTQTLYTTSTYSTSSVSTSIFNQVDTITNTVTFSNTQCQVFNTTAGADPTCLSSTVVLSSTLNTVVATTPITQIATVPVLVPQTNPYQTLFSPCPDSPTPTQTDPTTTTSQTDSTTTTSPLSTIIHTQYSTYTDSNGVHTASTTISSTIDPAPIPGGGSTGKNSVPLGTIIGAVVGGLVGLLALSALVWFLLWRREQNKFLFDDDDDFHGAAAGGMTGNRPTALLAARNGGGRRNVNSDDEITGASAYPYEYGVVGGSPSPNTTPSLGSANATAGGGAYHSQPSTMSYGHQRNSSRDALMTAHSPPVSPRHLDVPLPGGGGGSMGQQRRASQYTGSSGMTDTIMMANQPPIGMANPTGNDMLGGGGRVSDERDASWRMMGHQPRPSSSLLEAPVVYPPGHGGFYQQYGPIDQQQPQQFQQPQQPHQPHQPQGPIPTHQALYAAAGLGSPDFYPQGQGQGRVLPSPPPGAGGARRYTTSAGVGPSGTSGDKVPSSSTAVPIAATATATSTSPSPDAGFGRQRRSAENARELRTTGESGGVRSPVIQHLDGGRVPDGAGGAAGPVSLSGSGSAANTTDGHAGDAPPPAYSDP